MKTPVFLKIKKLLSWILSKSFNYRTKYGNLMNRLTAIHKIHFTAESWKNTDGLFTSLKFSYPILLSNDMRVAFWIRLTVLPFLWSMRTLQSQLWTNFFLIFSLLTASQLGRSMLLEFFELREKILKER